MATVVDNSNLHSTIDSQFRDTQYNPRGIRSVSVTLGQRANNKSAEILYKSGNQLLDNGRQLRAYTDQLDNQTITSKLKRKIVNQSSRSITRLGKASRVAARHALTGRGNVVAAHRLQVTLAMGLASFISAIAAPFGLLALGGFGAIGIISYIPGGETVLSIISWFTGDAVFVFAIFCYVIYSTFVLIMFTTAWVQLTLGRLHPTSGNTAGWKIFTFLLAFVLTLFPGASVLFLINIWLLFVLISPK